MQQGPGRGEVESERAKWNPNSSTTMYTCSHADEQR
ncbi:hypothetical protein TSMEX_005413 [Taenia solium]|eukprot:TsM_000119100 transcript=TsM_000119100 gene=TsM_000119100